mmetsp:Transcript_28162/g.52599  ORF Transcript_28162/g.52599 Transcript_28162/m.52599 type:complete len:147 (-) Transcript_28162:1700-2140(-)
MGEEEEEKDLDDEEDFRALSGLVIKVDDEIRLEDDGENDTAGLEENRLNLGAHETKGTNRSASALQLQAELAEGLQMPKDFSFRSHLSTATTETADLDLKTPSLKARFFIRSDSAWTTATAEGNAPVQGSSNPKIVAPGKTLLVSN